MEEVEDKAELNCSSMCLLWKKLSIYVNSFVLLALESGDVCSDDVLAW